MDDHEEAFVNGTALVRAAEEWADIYKDDPESHGQLIKNEARWQLAMAKFFRDMSNETDHFINWYAYSGQLKADYDVEVVVDDDGIYEYGSAFMKISYDYVVAMTLAGALSGENTYKMPMGISSASENIQKLSSDQVAALVGKKVLPDGSIIDNPNPEYNVLQTVRDQIAQSVKTSLGLGETVEEATARIQKIIKDPKRSERIARTESVNAYQRGLNQFAIESNAVGKEWLDVGAVDVCAEYADLGPVSIDYLYGGTILTPTAHIGCRCGLRYIHSEEWDKLQK